MASYPVDYTARIPTETLHEIIEWLEDRKDLNAVVHICSRWRRIAFAHPRRYCWFDCKSQVIRATERAQNELCYAQLRCRADHEKRVDIQLSDMSAVEVDIALGLLEKNMGRLSKLAVGWRGPAAGHRVLELLSRRPAPSLNWFELADSGQYRADGRSGEDRPRISSDIFAGEIPPLTMFMIKGVRLPQAPLKQFSTVPAVVVGGRLDKMPHLVLAELVAHFPAMTGVFLCEMPAILTDSQQTSPAAGIAAPARLQHLLSTETVLNALLDAWPQLGALPNINILQGSPGITEERTLTRLLAHFKNLKQDISLEAHSGRGIGTDFYHLQLKADAVGSKVAVERHFDISPALLAKAPDPFTALRITRAQIEYGVFSAVWPLLPPGTLQRLHLVVSTDAFQDADLKTLSPPHKMPALRKLVVSAAQPPGRVSLSVRNLATFLRAAFIMDSGSPDSLRPTLRLENVDIDRWTRGTKRMLKEIVHHRHRWSELPDRVKRRRVS